MNEAPTENCPAHYAAVYAALHHISCVVNDVVIDISKESKQRHRGAIWDKRVAELKDAAAAINLYDSTPPAAIARTYEEFCANIASTEHLRLSNKRLADNWRAIEAACKTLGGLLREWVEEHGPGQAPIVGTLSYRTLVALGDIVLPPVAVNGGGE